MKRAHIFFVSLLLLCIGCKDDAKSSALNLDYISLDPKFERFDKDLAQTPPDNLGQLKAKYPYLYPVSVADSVWQRRMQDTLQLSISKEVAQLFPDLETEKEGLTQLYKHIKYYFPKTRIPKTVTLAAEVDYAYRVVLADSLLLIGLQNYLGPDHKFYQGLPRYVTLELDKKYLLPDVAGTFAKQWISMGGRRFLDQIIGYGKELYLKQKLLPQSPPQDLMHYSEAQWQWAQANEEQIWRYFIERELLYSTDKNLERRFLTPAPFSKFQLELDSESPGKIGRYMGWQIVNACMEKNDLSLHDLLQLPADEIFKRANYKPRR